MTQAQQIFDYAACQYSTQPEYLWAKFPEYAVLRHNNAKGKWYALIGKIAKAKLGLQGEGETDFINLKCPPDMVNILQQAPHFLPAYHMNKIHWLTIVLDHGVQIDEILKLLDWSYDLTK
ncbi:MmcQ/YjbR family DNA-binding protein [Necropsobacter massiliensis]|uniref:MmcQ/YjbR family DNA-binding protein n=1 Tax=Necropsobacter massiliensis TaxID=1400001 RepID=UPI000595DAD4|nr:MmcQ/YjbR family DNA-binding protein [Necropsobacter massiliensis]